MKKYDLTGKIIFITGAGGLLGGTYCEAVAEIGGIPILYDKNITQATQISKKIKKLYDIDSLVIKGDITSPKSIKSASEKVIKKFGKIDILINNAANNPQVDKDNNNKGGLEELSLQQWKKDIDVSLTGTFLCIKIIGQLMVKNKFGNIINISSDLGLISPDQRIYIDNLHDSKKNYKKPISYSAAKHGIIGLSKYVSTYWAGEGIRCNTFCPGGVYNNQPKKFVSKLKKLIPMNRMANVEEYKSAIQFLCSEASSYMNGSTLVMDGGRTAW